MYISISNISSYPWKLEFSSAPLLKLPSSFIYISFNANHFRLTHALCLETWKNEMCLFLIASKNIFTVVRLDNMLLWSGHRVLQILVPWLSFSVFPVTIKFRGWKFGTKTTFINAHIKHVMCWITTLLCLDIIIITSNIALKNVLQKGITDQTTVPLFQCPRLYGYPVF
jgi:hypothetical protein